MLIIGSHVNFTSKEQLLGSLKTSLEYGSNAFMIYTGAPQNTARSKIDLDKTNEAINLMKENNIELKNIIVHGHTPVPYILNNINYIGTCVYEDGTKICIDPGSVDTGRTILLDLDTFSEYMLGAFGRPAK